MRIIVCRNEKIIGIMGYSESKQNDEYTAFYDEAGNYIGMFRNEELLLNTDGFRVEM